MAKQKDVAKKAGVSQSTVSRFINKIGFTSPENKKEILNAIEKLNYKPNLIARSLKLRSSKTIGFVFSDIRLPFFNDIIKEAEEIAHAHEYNVIICNSNNNAEKERMYIEVLKDRFIDGILLDPVISNRPENYSYILKVENVVFITRSAGLKNEFCVKLDNYRAMELALEHLLSLGHARIGIINVPLSITPGIERFEAYKKILRDHNIKIDKSLIKYTDFTRKSGYEQTLDLLKSNERPTAVLTLSSRKTIGALKAIKELNLKIPDDISVIGFDEFAAAELLTPPLTMISQPISEFGNVSINMLLKMINGEQVQKKVIKLKPELLVRESCRKIS